MAKDLKTSYPRLRRFNLIMGLLHLIQGVAMIVLSNAATRPIYTSFLRFDVENFTLVPDPKVWINLRFGPAVAVFLLLSAVAHFYLSTIGFKRYKLNLEKGRNPIRFYEYALSSSVMIVVTALLVGIYDLGALIALFGVNAAMNLFGISMENHNQHTEKTNWSSFIYGCIAGIIPWPSVTSWADRRSPSNATRLLWAESPKRPSASPSFRRRPTRSPRCCSRIQRRERDAWQRWGRRAGRSKSSPRACRRW